MSHRSKKIFIILSCILIGLIVTTMGVAEFWMRSNYAKIKTVLMQKYPGQQAWLKADPNLLYVGVPNARGNNSQGYPDNEHSFVKPAGTFRLIIIGDSVAGGQGVKSDESFGKIIEKQLKTDFPGSKFEVILLAMTGYSTSQEIFLLQHQAFRYDPDLIIWSYTLNDPTHPVFNGSNGELGLYFFNPRSYLWAYFASKSYYRMEELSAIQNRCDNKEFHTFLHCTHWKEVQENVAKIARITHARKIPCVFVIHPIFENTDSFSNYSLASLHIQLAAAAKAQGLFVIDLLAAYQMYTPGQVAQRYNNGLDPWHPNALGHKIAGEYIAQQIKFLLK